MSARKTRKPPAKRGTGPQFHQVRVSRQLRDAASRREIGIHHIRPLLFRHLRVAGQPDPRAQALDENVAYVVAEVVRVGGVLDGPHVAARLFQQLEARPSARTGLNIWLLEADRRGLLQLEKKSPKARFYTRIQVTPKGIRLLGKFPPVPPDDYWLDGYEPGGMYRRGTPQQTVPEKVAQWAVPPVAEKYQAWAEPELPLVPQHVGPDFHVEAVYQPVPPIGRPLVTEVDPIEDMLALQKLALMLGAERDTWRSRYDQAERNIDDLVTRLGDASEEIARLRKLIPEAVLVRVDNGEDPLDNSIQGRLTADAKEQLAALMRELSG